MVGVPLSLIGFGREPAARLKKDAQQPSTVVTSAELKETRSMTSLYTDDSNGLEQRVPKHKVRS